MSERRDDDELSRVVAGLSRRLEVLERGRPGSVLVPAGHAGGGPGAAGVIGSRFIVTGPVSGQAIWALPVILFSTAPVVTLRVDSDATWTVAAGILRFDQAETAVTPATHGATGGWSGTLTLGNGGGTPVTSGVLYLAATVSGAGDQALVTTLVASG